MRNNGQTIKTRKLARVVATLEKMWGVPEHEPPGKVLDAVLEAILSQNTTDHNCALAFKGLRKRFRSAKALAQANSRAIESAVRPAGMGRQRAATIKRLLAWAKKNFGAHTLEPIRRMPVDEALALLSSVKGIGVKTAGIVLLFECQREVMPVDTHIARISRRLGLAPEKASPEKIFGLLVPMVAPGKALSTHLNLIWFGRRICRKRNPLCGECPVWDECVWPFKISRLF